MALTPALITSAGTEVVKDSARLTDEGLQRTEEAVAAGKS